MEVAPDCFVATWKVLATQKSEKVLRIRREGNMSLDVFSFNLGVVIVYKGQNVCMFRYFDAVILECAKCLALKRPGSWVLRVCAPNDMGFAKLSALPP